MLPTRTGDIVASDPSCARYGDIVASDPSCAKNENALQPPFHILKMLTEKFLRTPESAVLLALAA